MQYLTHSPTRERQLFVQYAHVVQTLFDLFYLSVPGSRQTNSLNLLTWFRSTDYKMFCKCIWFPAVECGPLSVPMNGSSSGDSTVFPNSVVFSCDPGFILNGSKTRTCWGNGTWSGTQALCSGKMLLLKRIQKQKNFMFRCLCMYSTPDIINLALNTTSLIVLTVSVTEMSCTSVVNACIPLQLPSSFCNVSGYAYARS